MANDAQSIPMLSIPRQAALVINDYDEAHKFYSELAEAIMRPITPGDSIAIKDGYGNLQVHSWGSSHDPELDRVIDVPACFHLTPLDQIGG